MLGCSVNIVWNNLSEFKCCLIIIIAAPHTAAEQTGNTLAVKNLRLVVSGILWLPFPSSPMLHVWTSLFTNPYCHLQSIISSICSISTNRNTRQNIHKQNMFRMLSETIKPIINIINSKQPIQQNNIHDVHLWNAKEKLASKMCANNY